MQQNDEYNFHIHSVSLCLLIRESSQLMLTDINEQCLLILVFMLLLVVCVCLCVCVCVCACAHTCTCMISFF
jgi:membrane-anchored protein YejM (alkaline phosphatase superfamily)